MRILALAVLLAIALASPLSSYAQDQPPSQDQTAWALRDPNEYRQEDSHPVRAIASLLSPVGWALEWGIARPWHYVANETFLAPVLNGGQEEDSWEEYYGSASAEPVLQPAVTQPALSQQSTASQQALREQDVGGPPVSTTTTTTTRTYQYQTKLGAPPAPSAASPGQATLH